MKKTQSIVKDADDGTNKDDCDNGNDRGSENYVEEQEHGNNTRSVGDESIGKRPLGQMCSWYNIDGAPPFLTFI